MAVLKTLLFVPTYNERENAGVIYKQIKSLDLDLDLLFVDDNSPDGTGQILDGFAAADPRTHVLHRPGKQGIGSAHLNAIDWAYGQGYAVCISMDCDLTHPPEHIPDFIAQAQDFDVVLGSRFMKSESLADWNLLRRFLTHLGHFLTRHVLHVPYDATGGFRLYRLDRIHPGVFKLVESRSYSFFFESLYILCLGNARVKEIPITLPKRTYGHSKMKLGDVFSSLQRLISLYLRSFHYKARLRELPRPQPDTIHHAGN